MRGSSLQRTWITPGRQLGPWRGDTVLPPQDGRAATCFPGVVKTRPQVSLHLREVVRAPRWSPRSSRWGFSVPGAGGLSGSLIYGPAPWCTRIWTFSKCVFNPIKSAGGQRKRQLPESLGSCPHAQYAREAGGHVPPLPPTEWLMGRPTRPPGGSPASVSPSVNGDCGYGKAGLEAHVP